MQDQEQARLHQAIRNIQRKEKGLPKKDQLIAAKYSGISSV